MASLREPLRGIWSAPIKLHWAGWETDTLSLQQAGWQVSAEQDPQRDRMRIFMQHEGMMMQAMTDNINFRYREALVDFSGLYVNSLNIPVQAIGRSITFQMHGTVSIKPQPIDAYPQMRHQEVHRMEDLVHFAPLLTRTNEIILGEAEVPDMLAEILKRQDPARQARLKASLREDRMGMAVMPRQQVHAQIISIAA